MKDSSQAERLVPVWEEQEPLMRAALAKGAAGQEALHSWLAQADPARLDAKSRQLLPLIYDRARRDGVEHPVLPVLKGVKLHAWYANQILFSDAASAIRALREAGIEVMLVKGAALVAEYYHDAGLRPMQDLDLLVPTKEAHRAFEVLRSLGYAPLWGSADRVTVQDHSEMHMVRLPGRIIDLHWHLLHSSLAPEADRAFWEASSSAVFQGECVRLLNPADHLLHVLTHAARSWWAGVPLTHWVADAIMIIGDGGRVNWPRFVEQARTHNVALALPQMLHWLARTLGSPIPDDTLSLIDSLPISAAQWVEFGRSQPRAGLPRVVRISMDYRRFKRDAGESSLSLAGYLRVRWGGGEADSVMSLAWRRLMAKYRRVRS